MKIYVKVQNVPKIKRVLKQEKLQLYLQLVDENGELTESFKEELLLKDKILREVRCVISDLFFILPELFFPNRKQFIFFTLTLCAEDATLELPLESTTNQN